MTKKLFLITTLSLLASLPLFGCEYSPDYALLNFTSQLKSLPNVEYKETAQWIEQTFVATDDYHQNMTDLLTNIISGNISVQQKIDAIIQLKRTEEQSTANRKNTESRNAFLIATAKITGTVLAVAGIVYYLYTNQPWKQ